jgi:hypothetical protein
MNEIMTWLEENATYENLIALANVLSTVGIGLAFVMNYVKNTKEKILGATKLISGVNNTIEPLMKKTVDGSLLVLTTEIKQLRLDNQRLLQATVLNLSGDPQSRIAAIKLLSETKEVASVVIEQSTASVIAEIKAVQVEAQKEIAKVEVIKEEIVALKETL